MKHMDINSDMGELPSAITDGSQLALMPSLTSVNVACGAHAGDEHTMRATVRQALQYKLAIGAHPGYPDRDNFGRRELQLPPDAVAEFVCEQVQRLAEIAAECGAALSHVKAHGALYNQAARNPVLAKAIADGVSAFNRNLIIVSLAGSATLELLRQMGYRAAAEAFADRRYEPDGTLRSRRFDNAIIRDPEQAAAQALRIAEGQSAIAVDGSEINHRQ